MDFPGLAIDETAVYLTGAMTKSSDDSLEESRLWILDKTVLYNTPQQALQSNSPYMATPADAPQGFYKSVTSLQDPNISQGAKPHIYMPAVVNEFSTKTDIFFGTYLLSYVWQDTMGNGIDEFLHL